MTLTLRGVRVRIGFFFAFTVCFLLTCSNSTVIRFAVLFSLLPQIACSDKSRGKFDWGFSA